MINSNTAVSITIICKSDIQAIINHIFLQNFNMRRTAVCIDICAVRLIMDYISLCLKCIKYTLCNCRRTSVCTVKTYFHTLEITARNRDQMSDVTVSSGCKVDSTSDVLFCCKRQILDQTVEICLDSCLNFCLNLLSVAVEKLNSIVIKWIVACRDHNSTIKIFSTYCIGNARSSRYMKKIYIRT